MGIGSIGTPKRTLRSRTERTPAYYMLLQHNFRSLYKMGQIPEARQTNKSKERDGEYPYNPSTYNSS